MANTPKRYSKILFQKGQADLVSAPFYVGDNRVALSAFANGTGLPPGARITFQEVVFVDGGRSEATLCDPGKQFDSKQYDYKPFVSCGCEPALTERLSYMEIDRAGWYRAVYVGPSRASVMLAVSELSIAAGTGCCSKPCCPIEVDLTIDKSVSSEVITSGDTGSFTILMSNLGPDSSRGGFLKDVLPAGLTYGVPSAVYAGGAMGSQPALAQLAAGDWHYTVIPPGGTITVTIPFTATSPGSYVPKTNTASIHPGVDEVDTNWVNNTDTVFYTIAKPVVDVWVTKSVSSENIKEGDSFTYTLTVGNAGPQDASGTTIKDLIPSGLGVNAIVAVYAGGASGVQPTQSQLASGYAVGAFPAGGSVVLTITGVAPVAGHYYNTATAQAPSSVVDANQLNNTASAPLSVTGKTVDLTITKAADSQTYEVGSPITYTVQFFNNGPSDANGAVIKDALPAALSGITIGVVFSGGAAGVPPTSAELASGWVVPTLPVGGSGVLTITGTPTSAGVIPNQASITAPVGRTDTNAGNNNAIVIVNVNTPPPPCETHLLDCEGGVLPCDTRVRQCCDTVVFVRDAANMPTGAGVCLAVNPVGWQDIHSGIFQPQAATATGDGRAILQLRDKQVLEGTIILDPNGNPGAYHTFTYTNPHLCPVLLEVDMYVSDNYSTDPYGDEAITMVHKISENLNEPLPQLNNTQVDRSVITNTVSDSGVNVGNLVTPFVGAYSAQTAYGAQYKKVLAPGATITLYGQSWLILYENRISASGGFVIHANKSLGDRVTLGGTLT